MSGICLDSVQPFLDVPLFQVLIRLLQVIHMLQDVSKVVGDEGVLGNGENVSCSVSQVVKGSGPSQLVQAFCPYPACFAILIFGGFVYLQQWVHDRRQRDEAPVLIGEAIGLHRDLLLNQAVEHRMRGALTDARKGNVAFHLGVVKAANNLPCLVREGAMLGDHEFLLLPHLLQDSPATQLFRTEGSHVLVCAPQRDTNYYSKRQTLPYHLA